MSDTNLHQCTRLHTSSSEPQPQHLVLDTIWSSIISIQPNTHEDGRIDARNILFIIINKLLPQVGISRQLLRNVQ